MFYGNDPNAARELYEYRLQAAANERFAQRVQTGRHPVFALVLDWLGRRLIAWSQRMQTRRMAAASGFEDTAIKRPI